VIAETEFGVAVRAVGLGGGAVVVRVVPETVTPLETSGVVLSLMAQTRKEYCVLVVNPVT
jgi:hypothetical protein